MPVLTESRFIAEITWLGMVPAGGGIQAERREALDLGFDGISGERHEGRERASCVRVKNLYPQGTEIRNVRQLTILSEEELALIAAEMGLDQIDPRHLGASMVIRGIPDLTFVPPSARLQAPDGATLTIDMENQPCVLPGREIEKDHGGFGPKFKRAAENRRGITAWVERPGQVKLGDALRLFLPAQRAWQGES
ncbi:MOSC domain-containing protein [Tritonibacter horizontis]|uniref:Putative metal-sulfur cluster biosynthesis proteins YuaD n=1 Tax=Tritonibacter horizontis TaxID=1768241 RepID=A0A132BVF4_9RHOB|nr:sulfurase [Tritonibacter horizontis]KUP92369.1 putative metal-sulfur cluster biosynthesis proteins YuaD [Tritonibacter horizontis]